MPPPPARPLAPPPARRRLPESLPGRGRRPSAGGPASAPRVGSTGLCGRRSRLARGPRPPPSPSRPQHCLRPSGGRSASTCPAPLAHSQGRFLPPRARRGQDTCCRQSPGKDRGLRRPGVAGTSACPSPSPPPPGRTPPPWGERERRRGAGVEGAGELPAHARAAVGAGGRGGRRARRVGARGAAGAALTLRPPPSPRLPGNRDGWEPGRGERGSQTPPPAQLGRR